MATGPWACALLVFEQPAVKPGLGKYLALRRAVVSPYFRGRFGDVDWPPECGPGHFFSRNRPGNTFTVPTPRSFADEDGTRVQCLAEAFDSTHQIFFLLYPLSFKSH
jgi:hypothetical protein